MRTQGRSGFVRTQLVEEVEVDLPSGLHLATALVALRCEPDNERVWLSIEGVTIKWLIDPEGEEIEVPDGQVEAVRKAVGNHALSSEHVAEDATEDALEQGHRFAGPGRLH